MHRFNLKNDIMRKQISMLLAVLIHLVLSSFQNNKADMIIGKWYAEDLSKSTIEFSKTTSGLYYGRIIQSDEKDKIDQTPFQAYKYDAKSNVYVGRITPASLPFELNGEITLLDNKTMQVVGSKMFLKKTYMLKRK